MIDRSALEDIAGRLLEAMKAPSGVSLILHLHGGPRYVTLSAREPENRSPIGFHTGPFQT